MNEFEADKASAGKGPCDCGCGNCGDKAVESVAVESGPDSSRRKLLFGGVVATPAIMLLSSRSALAAGQCTASAHFSVNLSKPQATDCKSLSPGCWKTTLSWPLPFEPGLPDPNTDWSKQFSVSDADLRNFFKNVAKCASNDSKLTTLVAKFRSVNSQATICSSYFPWAPSGLSFMQALHANGGDSTALLRHAVAGVLNAAQFGPQAFGYTVAEFIAMVNTRYESNDPQLTADLDYLGNDRGSASCPGGGTAQHINWCKILNV